jgi:murein DD-endopeptidase MepM/ murein hydrolase activator NlpD
MHFYILIFLLSFFSADNLKANDDVKNQLTEIAQSIRIAEKYDHELDNKLDEINNQKGELLIKINDNRIALAHAMHMEERLRLSGIQYAFLNPDNNFLANRQKTRHHDNARQYINTMLTENVEDIIALESLEYDIQKYKQSRTEIALSIDNKLNDINRLRDDQVISDQLKHEIDKLTKTYTTLDEFLKNLINIPVLDYNETRELQFTLPVSGVISSNNKNLEIKVHDGALATAPESGLVVYADEYGSLGPIIIINHGQNYISVLRGFRELLVKTGEEIIKDEPIGIIGNKWEKPANTPMLIYTLRYNEYSIHPMTKISGL